MKRNNTPLLIPPISVTLRSVDFFLPRTPSRRFRRERALALPDRSKRILERLRKICMKIIMLSDFESALIGHRREYTFRKA